MSRRIACGAVGALVFSAVLIAPSAANAKPVTGSVSCTLTGSATISPGLVLSADCSGGKTCPTGFQCTTSGSSSVCTATKKLKTTTTFNGTLSNCTGAQVNTKKGLQIDAGTIVKAVAKSITAVGQALPSCSGLTAPTTATVLKTTVNFTSGGAKLTSSKAMLTVGAAVFDSHGVASFPASGTVSGGAFKGQILTATAILDDTALDLGTLCTGGAPTTFTFNGVQGESTLDIP